MSWNPEQRGEDSIDVHFYRKEVGEERGVVKKFMTAQTTRNSRRKVIE